MITRLLIWWLLWASAALAPPLRADDFPECTPLRYAGGPQSERRQPYSQGLLWKVSRRGVAPSYVFGTIHVSDPRVTELPASVRNALGASERFVMEALLQPEGLFEFSQYLFNTDGTLLEQQIGSDLFERAAEIFPRYGIPPAAANMMKPWAAYATLSVPPDLGGMPLDMVLMALAQNAGLSLYGLESMEEQAETLGGLPVADQVRLLADTICHYDTVQSDVEEMIEYYRAGDLAKLRAVSEKYQQESTALFERVVDRLLTKRNIRMAERAVPHLMAGRAFIAVGALHLPGDQGILTLLERHGFTISRVY